MDDNLIRKTFAGCLILEKIGQGGMGLVYKAHHIKLNKVVCVKILARELEADPRNIDFFLREAEISKQLDHPNTVHVYDYGKEKDNYYIVMSFVEGKSLEQIVKEKKFLDIKEASNIMIGVFEGLAHAHSKNIIHRDIKPSNIIVNSQNVPRIIDFGLARRVVEEKQLTITGEMIGTAYFMSPEQGIGKRVDSRADLYSSGATYFYLLTGNPPFEGKSAIEVINKHINESLPNLYMLKPDLPIWVVKIIEKLMKKNPQDRYQSANEVIEELKKYKEKNYENIIPSNENFINLDEIKKNQENISNTIRIKPQEIEKNIEGIEIKTKAETEREKKETKGEKPTQIYQAKPQKKLQSKIIFFITRITYHLFYTFISFISLLIFSSFINYEKGVIESLTRLPYSIVFLIISLIFIFLSSRVYKIKSPFTYFFILIFALITSIVNSKNKFPDLTDISERIIYTIKLIKLSENSFFVISVIFALSSFIVLMGERNRTRRIISSVFIIISSCLLLSSLSHIIMEIKNGIKYLVIFISVIFGLANIYLKKNLTLIFFILIFLIPLYYLRGPYTQSIIEERYNIEYENYKKQVNEITLKTREKFYSNLENTDSSQIYVDLDEKIKQEIKQQLSQIKEPVKNEIKLKIEREYTKLVFRNIYSNYISSASTAIFFLWLLINFLFISDIFIREDYE